LVDAQHRAIFIEAMTRLTPREQELLARFLSYYERLDLGRVTPQTPLQRQFVDVCHGRRKPETEHEIAYQKHLLIVDEEWAKRTGRAKESEEKLSVPRRAEQKARRVIDVKGKTDTLTASERRNIEKYSPKPWKRKVSEPLGSRKDFKKDSGANWSNSLKDKL
jgi:uncharacterized protein YifE (UPF0438 family)